MRTTQNLAADADHLDVRVDGHPIRRFIRHFAEMVLAMVAGMLILEPVWRVIYTALGWSGVFDRADVASLVMATDMTLGMAIWMRHRGHGWASVAEMGAAMYIPFLVLFVPFWMGMLDGGTLMLAGHLLMLPAMVAAMLYRRGEYTRGHLPPPAPANRLVAALKHRWPTWLALLMTVDNWVAPVDIAPWIMMVLPIGYLVIGAARRRLNEPGVLLLQLGGLAAYLALTVVAMSVDENLARYLVGAGWIAHSVWDVLHHRAGKVVPRAFAEWCAVLDLVIGLTIIFVV
jgi:hypothetical protein